MPMLNLRLQNRNMHWRKISLLILINRNAFGHYDVRLTRWLRLAVVTSANQWKPFQPEPQMQTKQQMMVSCPSPFKQDMLSLKYEKCTSLIYIRFIVFATKIKYCYRHVNPCYSDQYCKHSTERVLMGVRQSSALKMSRDTIMNYSCIRLREKWRMYGRWLWLWLAPTLKY